MTLQQGAFSDEKDESLRAILAKLDSIDSDAGVTSLTNEDLTVLRRQLAEGQSVIRDTLDRLRQSQEEKEMVVRRKEELEERLATLEAEYEELLGKFGTVGGITHRLTSLCVPREDNSQRGGEPRGCHGYRGRS